jgi:chitinase
MSAPQAVRNIPRLLPAAALALLALALAACGSAPASPAAPGAATAAPGATTAAAPSGDDLAAPPAAGAPPKSVAYYISWGVYARNFLVKDIPADKLTHINYAFAKIKGNAVVLADPAADAQKSFGNEPADAPFKGNFYQLVLLKQKYPHLKTLISIGGWTLSDGFSTAAATPENREAFAASAVRFVRTYRFDGVDLDWEYPVSGGIAKDRSPDDKANFTLLLSVLRRALNRAGAEDGRYYLLTAAVTAGVDKIANLELPAIAGRLDSINVMAYDFHLGGDKFAAHQAPLFANPADPSEGDSAADYNIAAAVGAYRSGGVPAAKLVLGLPFYGRGWSGVDAQDQGLFRPGAGAATVGTWEKGVFDYDDIVKNYLAPDGSNLFWDDAAKASWLYVADRRLFISFDSERALDAKLDFVKDQGLGGVMHWELSADRGAVLTGRIAQRLGIKP